MRWRRILWCGAFGAFALTGWGACESSLEASSTPPPAVVDLSALATPAPAVSSAVSGVDRWRSAALRAGWPASAWPRLRCIIRRESHGDPAAFNGRDAHGGSRGLLQINGINDGWLIRKGYIRSAADLFDPFVNLRAGRAVWRLAGWRAWTSRRHPC